MWPERLQAAQNAVHRPNSDAKSGALSHDSTPIDHELQAIIEVWPSLPTAVKNEIVAMVGVAKTRSTNKTN